MPGEIVSVEQKPRQTSSDPVGHWRSSDPNRDLQISLLAPIVARLCLPRMALNVAEEHCKVDKLLTKFKSTIQNLPSHFPVGTRKGPAHTKFDNLEKEIDPKEGPYHALNRACDTVLQAKESNRAKLVSRRDKGITIVHATMVRFLNHPDIANEKFGGAGNLQLFALRVEQFIDLIMKL